MIKNPWKEFRGFLHLGTNFESFNFDTFERDNTMTESNRLRIAIQKSGRLSTDSQQLLKSCGVKFSINEQRLIAHADNMPIDLLRVRDAISQD